MKRRRRRRRGRLLSCPPDGRMHNTTFAIHFIKHKAVNVYQNRFRSKYISEKQYFNECATPHLPQVQKHICNKIITVIVYYFLFIFWKNFLACFLANVEQYLQPRVAPSLPPPPLLPKHPVLLSRFPRGDSASSARDRRGRGER